MQLEITNLTLRFLVEELRELVENAHVNKIQELPNKWLKIKIHTSKGTRDLIVAPSAIYLTSYSIPAKMQSTGFAAFLRKHLYNKRILSISQKGFDRVVVFEFENFYLIFELFAKGNVILTDKDYKILSPFHVEHWKDRTLRKGHDYKFPASKGINPSELTFAEFKKIAKKESGVASVLIKEINIAPFYAEEICNNLKVDRKEKFSKIKEVYLKKIHSAIKKLYTSKVTSANPVIVEKNEVKILLPSATKEKHVSHDSLSKALDEMLSKEIHVVKERGVSEKSEKGISALEFSYNQQLEAKEKGKKQISDNKKKAELIYENYQKINEIMREFEELRKNKLSEKEIKNTLSEKYSFLKSIDMKKQKLILEL